MERHIYFSGRTSGRSLRVLSMYRWNFDAKISLFIFYLGVPRTEYLHWEEVCYKKLKRLLKLLKKTLQTASYIKADETSLKYLHDEGLGKASNGWMWVFHAPEHKLVLFEFHPGRDHEVPKEILKDFAGTLQTDALSSYSAAFKENEKVTLMSCLAHIRRGFKKSQRQNKILADQVLVYFNIIYRIEAYAKRKAFTPDCEFRILLTTSPLS